MEVRNDVKNEQNSNNKYTKVIPTFIEGFDDLLIPPKGDVVSGIPLGSTILVCGPIGSGKTTFVMDYLVGGIRKSDVLMPGIFVTLEESPVNLLKDYSNFINWNLDELINEKKLIVIDAVSNIVRFGELESEHEIHSFEDISRAIDDYGVIPLDDINYLPDLIVTISRALKKKYKTPYVRLGIDSITTYISHQLAARGKKIEEAKNIHEVRSALLRLKLQIEKENLTTLMSGEASEFNKTRFGIEEFISRGVIFLGYQWVENDRIRYLTIAKMRGVNHRHERFSFVIDEDSGITVFDEVL